MLSHAPLDDDGVCLLLLTKMKSRVETPTRLSTVVQTPPHFVVLLCASASRLCSLGRDPPSALQQAHSRTHARTHTTHGTAQAAAPTPARRRTFFAVFFGVCWRVWGAAGGKSTRAQKTTLARMGSGGSVARQGMTGVNAGGGRPGGRKRPFYCPSFRTGSGGRPRRRDTLDLSQDFGFQHQKDSMSLSIEAKGSWKRKFSLGPTNNFKVMETLVNGRSIERKSECYDPLLVFTMDTTVLAAITVQRLVRGYFARKQLRTHLGGSRGQRLASLVASPSSSQELRNNSAFTNTGSSGGGGSSSDGSRVIGSIGGGASMRSRNQEEDRHFEEKADVSMLDLVVSHKQKAIEARRAGDTKLALEHMGKFKALKESLGDSAADILTPRMNRRGPADVTPESLETCKRKAIAARKAGSTELAVEYMADYMRMKASLESQGRFSAGGLLGEGQSRSSSTSPATHIDNKNNSKIGAAATLEARIHAAKSAAILAKRAGRQDEAIAQMKRYKSLQARRVNADSGQSAARVAVA
jgi:hypothetical protein